MSKGSLKGFIEFVDNQDIDKPINHDYWATCSVGEYMESLGEPLLEGLGDYEPQWLLDAPDLGSFLANRGGVHDIDDNCVATFDIDTYGLLWAAIYNGLYRSIYYD